MENISAKEFNLDSFQYKLIESNEQMQYYDSLVFSEVQKRRKERELFGVKPVSEWKTNDYGFTYAMFRKSDNSFLGLLGFLRNDPSETQVSTKQRSFFTSETSAARRLLLAYILLNVEIFNVYVIICNRTKVLVTSNYYQDFSNEEGKVYDVCRKVPFRVNVDLMEKMPNSFKESWGKEFKDEHIIQLIFKTSEMKKVFTSSKNFVSILES